ncbi:MAG: ABC transporter ATP-binding protein/permease [Lachnospiraceae bacterium]|nr:ABC transporter ATP-binding protein/permease [Lachnospiraceae bacterium]
MKTQSKDKISFGQAVRNNIYVMRLGNEISKSRVIHAFITKVFYYFEWIFFSAYFLKYIVNALDTGKDAESIFLFILLCGVLFFAINLYRDYMENVIVPLTDTRIYHGVYLRLYRKARNVELRCYENADFYNKYTMAIDDAGTKVSAIIDSFWGILTGIVAVAVVFYSMVEIAPLSVLFIISPLVGNFLFGAAWNRLLVERYQENVPNDKVINYVNRIMYLVDYAKEIRLSNVFRLLTRQYRDAVKGSMDLADKYAFKTALMEFLKNEFTFTVIFEGVLFYAIYENIVTKRISLAELTVMTSLMVSATWILIGLFDNIMNMVKNGMFISNLRTFLEYKEEIPEDQDGMMADAEFESLEFDHVSFAYQQEETIHDLCFTIRKGEVTALVGHNGAGKSTIIKLMLRLYDPTKGVIRLNGVDIRKYNLRSYRKLFAAAFQDVCLFGMTVRDNILMGDEGTPEEEARVIEALTKAGVYQRIQQLPHGIHTMMTKEFDEDGVVLSGGESQKVAVARAFYRKCPVKIFDEPSSALDPIAEYELFQSMMEDGKQNAMIFISHRLSSVKKADCVLMLERGRIIERGNHRELMELQGSYAEMYQKQAMNYLAVDSVEGMAL